MEPGYCEGRGEWQLHEDWVLFAITRLFLQRGFFFIYLTNTGVKIIVRFTEDFVINYRGSLFRGFTVYC